MVYAEVVMTPRQGVVTKYQEKSSDNQQLMKAIMKFVIVILETKQNETIYFYITVRQLIIVFI